MNAQSTENLERRNYDKDIALLFERLDEHFKEESLFRQEFAARVGGIEYHIESMDTYIKRVTEILERVTIIEERDKSHNKLIEDIADILKTIERQVQENKEQAQKKIGDVEKKIDKWSYTFSGASAIVVIVWALIGGMFNEKVKGIETIIERTKIHLAVDATTGHPAR